MQPESILFSIVIPTYNRPERLATCLQSLVELDYRRDRFEVIVVNDGSTVDLESVVLPVQQQLNLTLITQANAGPATARNTGATAAKGRFLIFTDDDCVLLPQHLTTLEARFAETPDGLIGGRTLNALPNNLCSTASQLLIDYLYDYFNTDITGSSFFASNNFAMPSDRFRVLGGFDTSFPLAAGEDREFCDRWLFHGYAMRYASDVQIYHAHNLTVKSFWRQHFNYGRGAFCFRQVREQRSHHQTTPDPIQVEPLRFYVDLVTYPFSRSSQHAIPLTILLFLSQVANVAGFFWARSQHHRRQQSLIPSSTQHSELAKEGGQHGD
ncbi:glycosyltransferase family 2 protein [Myxacorys almedinensis]|uniref:Glycosyltransferase n=1 Tax=Myxacorys almedinensis A TaxID=2690445 RepID=A0A8J7Z0X1_9CYAN|nr:glycosyltransferase [Myxacorys almedinensis]NDJ17664.1 glycosyltransferase [Myxacorys almedinensis A]